MKKRLAVLALLLLMIVIQGCKNSDETKALNGAEIISHEVISACSLLTKEKLSEFMGTVFKPAETIVENITPKGNYVSQCGYWTERGMKGVSILLRNDTSIPESISEILKYAPDEDEELKTAADDAIRNSTEVPGLGDYAVWYSFLDAVTFSFTFKGEYIVHIYFYDFGFNSDTMEKAKLIASEIMKKLS